MGDDGFRVSDRRERDTVRILDEDPALGRGLSDRDLTVAAARSSAPLVVLEPGLHSPPTLGRREPRLGALVLDGLFVRRLEVAGRQCGELIGAGTLLRCSGMDHLPLPVMVRWRVLERTRLALLDDRLVAALMPWPQITAALLERSLEREQMLAFEVGLHCLQRVEVRMLVLLWHLADRFGKVTPAGTVLPLRLTHGDLAELSGTQRPSVSKALGVLAREDRVRRRADRSWLLIGDPPAQLHDRRPRPVGL